MKKGIKCTVCSMVGISITTVTAIMAYQESLFGLSNVFSSKTVYGIRAASGICAILSALITPSLSLYLYETKDIEDVREQSLSRSVIIANDQPPQYSAVAGEQPCQVNDVQESASCVVVTNNDQPPPYSAVAGEQPCQVNDVQAGTSCVITINTATSVSIYKKI